MKYPGTVESLKAIDIPCAEGFGIFCRLIYRIVIRVHLSNGATAYLYWKDSHIRPRKWHEWFALPTMYLDHQLLPELPRIHPGAETVGDVSIVLCRGKPQRTSQLDAKREKPSTCHRLQSSASVFDRFTPPLHPNPSIHRCYFQRRIKRHHFHAFLEKIRPTIRPCLPTSQSRSLVLLGGSAF